MNDTCQAPRPPCAVAVLAAERPVPAAPSWARAFPGTAVQVSAARHFAADLLRGSLLRDDAVMVISELFTNAVLHTDSGKPGGLITVQISRWRGGVRIAVTDQGAPGTPVVCIPAAGGEPAEHGNGLFMVTCLARLLDWHDDASGRTVCAILGKLPPSRPAFGQTAPDRAWRP